MGYLELAVARYSVRSYSERPIETEKMEKILKAGQLAPTAVNFQLQKIYVLKSKGAIQKIRSLTLSAYDAPVVLLVCADKRKVWGSEGAAGASVLCQMPPAAFSVLGNRLRNRMLLCMEICE
ncbi:nitroreductase family protein [Lachnospiraceae bacterium 48-42]